MHNKIVHYFYLCEEGMFHFTASWVRAILRERLTKTQPLPVLISAIVSSAFSPGQKQRIFLPEPDTGDTSGLGPGCNPTRNPTPR